MALNVFISYSSRDRLDALRLKEIVESDGHDAWINLFDIHPAARLAKELEQGVSSADVLCLLVSPSAVESSYVHEEIEYALAAEAKGLRVMPVIVRAAPIPEQLADVVAIDATRGLEDPAVALRIRRALGGDVEEGVVLDAVGRAEFSFAQLVAVAVGVVAAVSDHAHRPAARAADAARAHWARRRAAGSTVRCRFCWIRSGCRREGCPSRRRGGAAWQPGASERLCTRVSSVV